MFLYCPSSVEIHILLTKYDLKQKFVHHLPALMQVAKKYDLALYFISTKTGFNIDTVLNEMVFRIGARQKERTSSIASQKSKSSLPPPKTKRENCTLM
jgi:hypothetical protein